MYIRNSSKYFDTINKNNNNDYIDNFYQLDKNGNNILMVYFLHKNAKQPNNQNSLEISPENLNKLINLTNLYHKNYDGQTPWMLYLLSNVNLSDNEKNIIFSCALDEKDIKNKNIFYYLEKHNKIISMKSVFGKNFIKNYKYLIKDDILSFANLLLNKEFINTNKEEIQELINYVIINCSDKEKIVIYQYLLSQNPNIDFSNKNIDFEFINILLNDLFNSINDFSIFDLTQEDHLDNQTLAFFNKNSYWNEKIIPLLDKNYPQNTIKKIINYALEFNENLFFICMSLPRYAKNLNLSSFLNSSVMTNDNIIKFLDDVKQELSIKDLQENDYKFLIKNLSYSNKLTKNQNVLLNIIHEKSISSQNNKALIELYEKSFFVLEDPSQVAHYILSYLIDYMEKETSFFVQNNNTIELLLQKFINIEYELNFKQKNFLITNLMFVFSEILNKNDSIIKHVDNNGFGPLNYLIILLEKYNIDLKNLDKNLLISINKNNRGMLSDCIKTKEFKKYISSFNLKSFFGFAKKEKEVKNNNLKINDISSNYNEISNLNINELKDCQYEAKKIFNEDVNNLINQVITNFIFLHENLENNKFEELKSFLKDFYAFFDNYKKIISSPVINKEFEINATKIFVDNLSLINNKLDGEIMNYQEKLLTNMQIENNKLKK